MKELESPLKAPAPVKKANPVIVHPPSRELKDMTTDELTRKLLSAEMAQPANASIRQKIIMILQEREGNAFVQRILGKSPGRNAK